MISVSTVYVVIATGPSITPHHIDLVRAKHAENACQVIVVNDAYLLMPTATALVANDACWWEAHPKAREFAGRKFSGRHVIGIERLPFDAHFGTSLNSGLQGMRCAQFLGAQRILLLGFDLSAARGAHYFGEHPAPLQNTTPRRFRTHIQQFKRWRGPEVINCTPGSALKQFPMSTIEKELGIPERSVA